MTKPPLSMEEAQVWSLDAKGLLGVGEIETGGSKQSMIVFNDPGVHPNQWQQLPDVPFVAVDEGYALSQNGAIWRVLSQGDLDPEKNVVLTTALSGLGVSGWNTLEVGKDSSGSIVQVLAGGSSDILARCIRSDESSPWQCVGEDIGAFVGIEFLAPGWVQAPDFWVGSLGTDGSVFILGDQGGWDLDAPLGCGSNDAPCGLETLSALKSWPQVELALALGSPGAVLRWSNGVGWTPQGPPSGAVGPSLTQFEFRDAARDANLLLTVGYEHSCLIASGVEECPITAGRWWLWPALIGSESLDWLAPILVHESWCELGQESSCSAPEDLGPRGLSRDSVSSRWILSGRVQEGIVGSPTLLLWRP